MFYAFAYLMNSDEILPVKHKEFTTQNQFERFCKDMEDYAYKAEILNFETIKSELLAYNSTLDLVDIQHIALLTFPNKNMIRKSGWYNKY